MRRRGSCSPLRSRKKARLRSLGICWAVPNFRTGRAGAHGTPFKSFFRLEINSEGQPRSQAGILENASGFLLKKGIGLRNMLAWVVLHVLPHRVL